MIKRKKAWIRIVEASVAIFFLAGISLLILHQGNITLGEGAFENEVYDSQIEVLREVQTNDTLRADILSTSFSSLPFYWNDASFPSQVKTKIEDISPSALTCQANICSIEDSCLLQNNIEGNVYSEFVIISVTTTQDADTMPYNPRKLKLFCW